MMTCRVRVVIGGLVVVIIAGSAYTLARPALAFLVEKATRDNTIVTVSLLTTSFLVARSVAAPFAGYLGDKRPSLRVSILQLALFPSTIILIGMWLMPHPLTLIALMAVWGFLSGVYWPTAQYAVSRVAGTKALGTYFGLGGLGMSIGYFIYSLPFIDDMNAILYSALILGLSAAIAYPLFSSTQACMTISQDTITMATINTEDKATVDRLATAILAPRTLWVLSASLLLGSTRGVLGEFLYVYLARVHGVEKSVLGSVLGFSQLVSIAGSISAGFLASRLGIHRVLLLVILLNSLGLIIVSAKVGLILVAFSLSLLHFTVNASMPLTRNVLVSASPIYAGTVIGISNTLSNIGGAVTPVIGALLYESIDGVVATPLLVLDKRGLVFLVLAFSGLFLALTYPLIRHNYGST